MLKLGTVFSGIGAVEHALERLGIQYEIEFACDNGERKLKTSYEDIEKVTRGMTNSERDKYVADLYDKETGINYVEQSYKANYKIDDSKFYQDVKLIDGREYKNKVDLFVGGSPCQSFSVMGKHGGLEEARGTLFYEYARLVEEIQPKVFIYENVTGMLKHDKGHTWEVISNIFDTLGYSWKYWVLNATDFGLPQNRRRIFVVGFRKELSSFFDSIMDPQKIKLKRDMSALLEDNIPNKYYLPEKGFKRVIDPNQKKHVALNGTIARCQVACQQYNWFGDMRLEKDIPNRLEEDERIYKGEYNGKRSVARCLTPRECLRLMGYQDDFKIVVPDPHMYRQCGNSIAVNVMMEVVRQIHLTGVFKEVESDNHDRLQVATVFSGIGSPEFALKRLGISHDIVFACDNGEIDMLKPDDEIAEEIKNLSTREERKTYVKAMIPPRRVNAVKKSYLANYDMDEEHYYHNVRFLEGEEYKGNVDLFIGGSPCQSFTLLGYQKGLEEARGTLFYEFARLVKEIEPKAFIYENVQGLLKHDKGRTWEVVQRVFDSLGYKLHTQVLDAVDYGIPQKRRRVFVVGFKEGGDDFRFPKEKELKFTMQSFLLENAAEGHVQAKNKKIEVTPGGQTVPEKYFLSERILPGIMCEGTGGFSMKPEIDLKIARPLMSTMHKMHRAGEDNYVTTNGRIRRLAPRECLRLMGFTDDFKIAVADTPMYKQAGNSVVVDVMMGLIEEILKCMEA
jgi:DNA (cytosine-5-)-methyltransferase